MIVEAKVQDPLNTPWAITIKVRAQEGAPPHTQTISPGYFTGPSTFADTDISAKPQEVKDACAAAWTADVVTAFKAAFPYVAPLPSAPEQTRVAAINGNSRRKALVTAIQGSDDAALITFLQNKITDLPTARTVLIDLALLVAGVIRN